MPLARSVPENGSPDHSPRTILVVEDDVLVRVTLAEFLRDSGYRVIEAANAAEARAVLGAGTEVDLVFSDVRMPGDESGASLAGWIRQRHPRIAMLLTSGFADPAATAGLPADVPILPKPYILAVVLQKIQLLLRDAASGNG